MSALALNRTVSFLAFDGTSGASPQADEIPSQHSRLVSRYLGSATGTRRFAEPTDELYRVYRDCKQDNWNGDGAAPISRDTVGWAEQLLLALPSHLPTPEIFADPTGAIAFQWYRRPKHRLVLSIYGNGVIEFAGLLGVDNEVYGSARMAGRLPRIIRDHLRELFTD